MYLWVYCAHYAMWTEKQSATTPVQSPVPVSHETLTAVKVMCASDKMRYVVFDYET